MQSFGYSEVSLRLTDTIRNIVEELLSQGLKGPAIIDILAEKHGISISASTLTNKQKAWALGTTKYCNHLVTY